MNSPYDRSFADRQLPIANSNPIPMTSALMQYYVFSADNHHVGPVSAELIGQGVAAGKLPRDALVAPLGTHVWVPLTSIPALNLAVSAATVSSVAPPSVGAAPAPSVAPPSVGAAPTPSVAPPSIGAAPTPSAAPAAAAAEEKKKPAVDPSHRLIPLAIFGGFALLGALETVITLVRR